MQNLIITTEAGTTILPEDSKVICKIGEDKAVVKSARDLQEGEKVLYEFEWVKISLPDVQEILVERDPSYRQARDYLFRQEAGDDGVVEQAPYLSHYLNEAFEDRDVKSMSGKIGVVRQHLEDYNKKRGLRLSRWQKAVRWLRRTELPQPLEYHDTTIKAWIDGTTLKPERDEALDAVSVLHEDLERFYDEFVNHGDAYWFYSIYTIMNREIMAYIAKRGIPKEKIKVEERRELQKSSVGEAVSRGLDITLSALQNEIQGGTLSAVVTSVRKAAEAKSADHLTQTGYKRRFKLAKGIACVKSDEDVAAYHLTIKSPGDLINEYTLLEVVAARTLCPLGHR